jgi:hypothetical protein
MKETLKKVFKNKIVEPVMIGLGVFFTFTFIVFPGLTAADTIINIISALVGIFTLVFLFYYINGDKLFNQPTIEPGETELDYIPQDEIVKKKRNPKQFDGVKNDGPFIKTRKKSKKSEFPMEPHKETVKSSLKTKNK